MNKTTCGTNINTNSNNVNKQQVKCNERVKEVKQCKNIKKRSKTCKTCKITKHVKCNEHVKR